MFLAALSTAYEEEKLDDGSERIVLKFPPFFRHTSGCSSFNG